MMIAAFAAPLLILAAPPVAAAAEEPALTPATEQPAPAAPAATEPASPRTAPNVIFAEAFGSGLLYSVNYERMFDAWNIGLRGGASYFTYSVSSYGKSGNLVLVTFPIVASYYIGWRSHNLQLGLGLTIIYTGVATDSEGTKFEGERSGAGLAANGVIGYRYMPRDGGISLGVGFTPLIRTSKFLPWGGASIGYAF
jgi:hypothetical protein